MVAFFLTALHTMRGMYGVSLSLSFFLCSLIRRFKKETPALRYSEPTCYLVLIHCRQGLHQRGEANCDGPLISLADCTVVEIDSIVIILRENLIGLKLPVCCGWLRGAGPANRNRRPAYRNTDSQSALIGRRHARAAERNASSSPGR